ncbi:MAG: hypothetical protein JJU11_15105 [Candidatus Sumerlaeia bacterium]|nr:hypothetical protein [Candidatus Sumerlaeia bacterium]
MAPEVLAGKEASIQSDIYALGIMLYQIVACKFGHTIGEGWRDDVTDPLLSEDIAGCVHQDPKRRFKSASELAERLRNLDERHAEIERQKKEEEKERIKEEENRRLQEKSAQDKKRRMVLLTALGVMVLLLAISGYTILTVTAAKEGTEAALEQAEAAKREAERARDAESEALEKEREATETLTREASYLNARVAGSFLERGLYFPALEALKKTDPAHRNFEFGFIASQSLRELFRIDKHESRVRNAVFSRDGNLIASSTANGMVHVFDKWTGRELWKRQFGTSPSPIVFTRDGDGLLVGHQGQVELWNWPDDTRIREFPIGASSIHGHPNRSEVCIIGSEAVIVDYESGETIRRFDISGSSLNTAMHPDGTHLATFSRQALHIYEWDTGIQSSTTELSNPDGDLPRHIAWRPDGGQIAFAYRTDIVTIDWPDTSVIKIHEFPERTVRNRIYSLNYSSDSRKLLFPLPTDHRRVYVYDLELETGAPFDFHVEHFVSLVVPSPTENIFLLSGDRTLLHGVSLEPVHLNALPASQSLTAESIRDFTVTDDERLIYAVTTVNELLQVDSRTMTVLWRTKLPLGRLVAVSVSENQEYVGVVLDDHRWCVVDSKKGAIIAQGQTRSDGTKELVNGMEKGLRFLEFVEKDQFIITGDLEGNISKIDWRNERIEQSASLDGYIGIGKVSLDRSREIVLIGSARHRPERIVNYVNMEVVQEINTSHLAYPITNVTNFFGDYGFVVIKGSDAIIGDWRDGTYTTDIQVTRDYVWGASIVNDGERLVTLTNRGQLDVWDLEQAELLLSSKILGNGSKNTFVASTSNYLLMLDGALLVKIDIFPYEKRSDEQADFFVYRLNQWKQELYYPKSVRPLLIAQRGKHHVSTFQNEHQAISELIADLRIYEGSSNLWPTAEPLVRQLGNYEQVSEIPDDLASRVIAFYDGLIGKDTPWMEFASENLPRLIEIPHLPMGTRTTVKGVVKSFVRSDIPTHPHRLTIADASLPGGIPIVFWNNTGTWVEDALTNIEVGNVIGFSGTTGTHRGSFQLQGHATSRLVVLEKSQMEDETTEIDFLSEEFPNLSQIIELREGSRVTVEGIIQLYIPSTVQNIPHRVHISDASLPGGVQIIFWDTSGDWVEDAIKSIEVGRKIRFTGRTSEYRGVYQIRGSSTSEFLFLDDSVASRGESQQNVIEVSFQSLDYPPLYEISNLELGEQVTVEGEVLSYIPSPASNVPHQVTIADTSLPKGFVVVFWDSLGDWVAESVPHLVPGKRIRFTGLTDEFRGDFQIKGVEDSMLEILEDPPSAD